MNPKPNLSHNYKQTQNSAAFVQQTTWKITFIMVYYSVLGADLDFESVYSICHPNFHTDILCVSTVHICSLYLKFFQTFPSFYA